VRLFACTGDVGLRSFPAVVAFLLTAALPVPLGAQPAGAGRVVRAVRLVEPLTLDGRLDEPIYGTVPPAGDFVQQEPLEGAATTEPTDVWVFFDDENLYVAARCHHSRMDRLVATELRRDSNLMSQNDSISVVLDTFLDRRNGFYFQTTPNGGIRDQAIIEESGNSDWNTVWEVRVSRSGAGWAMEMAIPFKSLRYAGSGAQTWGINVRRVIKWKNEMSYLAAVPAAWGPPAIWKLERAATLVGVEAPEQSINLEVKPYAVASLTTDRGAVRPYANDPAGDVGLDFKYGLTRGLIFDATINTDFAQIEEDVQQVNLTRFSLFFPEKRDFFLEGQGIFYFGNPPAPAGTLTPGDVPVVFFSRRIGLSQGQAVPVRAGGRLTGKVGRASIGLVNIQTGDKPEAGAVSTNFTAARAKLDILRRSSIGAIVTRRAPSGAGTATNLAFGGDVSLLLNDEVTVQGSWARTSTPGRSGGQDSYRATFGYDTDRYGLTAEHLNVGAAFNPEIGYVQRTDFARTTADARFSPRVRRSDVVRQLSFEGGFDVITGVADARIQNRRGRGEFGVDFENSDTFALRHTREYERLPRDFAIAPGVAVPAGGYSYETTRLSYQLGQQRLVSGTFAATVGSLYGGTRREISYNGRVAPTSLFAVEPRLSVNWVDLPFGSFRVTQLTSRIIVSPTPRLLVSSLIQYNAGAASLSASVRLHWEYRSGSDFYAVYSDGRDTSATGFPQLVNRTLAVKLTRLVRF